MCSATRSRTCRSASTSRSSIRESAATGVRWRCGRATTGCSSGRTTVCCCPLPTRSAASPRCTSSPTPSTRSTWFRGHSTAAISSRRRRRTSRSACALDELGPPIDPQALARLDLPRTGGRPEPDPLDRALRRPLREHAAEPQARASGGCGRAPWRDRRARAGARPLLRDRRPHLRRCARRATSSSTRTPTGTSRSRSAAAAPQRSSAPCRARKSGSTCARHEVVRPGGEARPPVCPGDDERRRLAPSSLAWFPLVDASTVRPACSGLGLDAPDRGVRGPRARARRAARGAGASARPRHRYRARRLRRRAALPGSRGRGRRPRAEHDRAGSPQHPARAGRTRALRAGGRRAAPVRGRGPSTSSSSPT